MALHFSKQVLKDIQEKLLILFRALEEGANLTMPVSRQMSGYPGLKELRVQAQTYEGGVSWLIKKV